MKFFNLLLIFILAYEVSNAQIVNIPDPNFKTALIDEGVDTNNDGEIQVSEAEAVLSLNVSNRAISSLEGIQSFINLEDLFCSNNEISDLDMSQNGNLEWLDCGLNMLISLHISQNTDLKILSCNNNLLSSLDISQNSELESLVCNNNQLTSLFIDNGNNDNMGTMICLENLDLTCIQVDNEAASYPVCGGFPLEGWCKDEWTSYSEDCDLGIPFINDSTAIFLYPNPVSGTLHVQGREPLKQVTFYGVLGQVLMTVRTGFGNIDVSSLPTGLYFVEVRTEKGTVVERVVKL